MAQPFANRLDPATDTRYEVPRLRVALVVIALAGACAGCSTPAPHSSSTHAPRDAVDSVGPNPVPVATDSSSAEAAAAAIHAYYNAIEMRDYRRAYALWSGDGSSSGKSYASFAAGFANTAHVTVTTGEPGAIEGAAGSRYVEIPAEVDAVTRQGGAQRFHGSYVLRRAEVDGATAAQRRWHIASAKLTPVASPAPGQ